MITKDEIESKSKEFEIHSSNVEQTRQPNEVWEINNVAMLYNRK